MTSESDVCRRQILTSNVGSHHNRISLRRFLRNHVDRRKSEVGNIIYPTLIDKLQCLFQQFGALYMHNLDDKHPTRPTFEPNTATSLGFKPHLDRASHRRLWITGAHLTKIKRTNYSVKRSDVTRNTFEWLRWKWHYVKSPSPVLHCIRLLGENIAGQGYWVSQNDNFKKADFASKHITLTRNNPYFRFQIDFRRQNSVKCRRSEHL